VNLPNTLSINLRFVKVHAVRPHDHQAYNYPFWSQELFHFCATGSIENNLHGRFEMNEQQNQQPEQSGTQVALGIAGFIIGTTVILYLIKVFLF
jgi:hypothetical protein